MCVCIDDEPLEKYPVDIDDDNLDWNLQVINLVVRLLHHHRMIIMLLTSTCSIIFPNRSQRDKHCRGQDFVVLDDSILLASPYTWRFRCF